MQPTYSPRVVDLELVDRLAATGAVVIEGPRACGKTATARQLAASEVLLDIDLNARQAAAVVPRLVLEGPTPRLIDEWQLVPEIWDQVRRWVEDRRNPGQFILTGSAVPADEITRHSGAGRITRLRMRPMSLFEAGISTGTVSLSGVLGGQPIAAPEPAIAVQRLAEEIIVGGWPGFRHLPPQRAQRAVRDYLDEIARVDIGRIDGGRHDPGRVRRLLRSLGRNVATYVSISTLATDTGGDDNPIDRETVRDYLVALKKLMILEDQPAWAPHLRSRYRLREAAKRHFVDPSLAASAMGASPESLLRDLNLFGFLFESLVIRDLRVYAQANDATVLQYRDSDGLEVDAVVEASDGRWAAFEVKLGGGLVEEGVSTLKKFVNRIDTAKCGQPAALAVITGTGYAYTRPDGIAILPITALRS
ncbi:MAG TPA: DUF4143 domain-containing protein [Candidatus Dormibacteraeota bacterium]|nr:DUF4143 domain-containing protein [Candidatus Dormibacteraeota bacterium]